MEGRSYVFVREAGIREVEAVGSMIQTSRSRREIHHHGDPMSQTRLEAAMARLSKADMKRKADRERLREKRKEPKLQRVEVETDALTYWLIRGLSTYMGKDLGQVVTEIVEGLPATISKAKWITRESNKQPGMEFQVGHEIVDWLSTQGASRTQALEMAVLERCYLQACEDGSPREDGALEYRHPVAFEGQTIRADLTCLPTTERLGPFGTYACVDSESIAQWGKKYELRQEIRGNVIMARGGGSIENAVAEAVGEPTEERVPSARVQVAVARAMVRAAARRANRNREEAGEEPVYGFDGG